ncbi:DEKNAAC102807 [Brettanomyces naardenensis]|uniref:Trehalase n=1 Tax=Brettanomyces naardenensis TaxID=13370 RepID=A0A448YLZ4_BRENA|nr:DEKNAAC102807 [Brettanomyces naardenensis]
MPSAQKQPSGPLQLAPQDVSSRTRKSSGGEVDPYETPDLYYGPQTDPSNRHTHWGRLRTLSSVFPRRVSPVQFNPTFLEGDPNKTKGVTEDRTSHATNGLFDFGDDESVISDEDEEDNAEAARKHTEQAAAHNHSPRARRGSRITDQIKAVFRRKKLESHLGAHGEAFFSQAEDLGEHANAPHHRDVSPDDESDFEEDELAANAASPSNSTGSLLALENQLRTNNYVIGMPRSGVTSPVNRSTDELGNLTRIQNKVRESRKSDAAADVVSLASTIGSEGSTKSETDAEPVSTRPSSQNLLSRSEEALSTTTPRSKSFVRRYNKGIKMWNQIATSGRLQSNVFERRWIKGQEADGSSGNSDGLFAKPETSRGITPPETPRGVSTRASVLPPFVPTDSSLRRRASADDSSSKVNSKRFFISDIDATLEQLLANEDTDHNCQITIEDTGPKVLKLGTANSNGFKQYDIRGTYMLSNLLQELTIAKRMGREQMILDEARLNENPVARLQRLITTVFWKNLTRQVNQNAVLQMARDTKIKSPDARFPRIYVPHREPEQYYYYCSIAKHHPDYQLEVEYLPDKITPEWVKSVNERPGFLALAMRHRSERYGDLEGYPFIVPGGRFNEQYGWDSYFETLGLLKCDKVEPCIGMCKNFIFEILHYGKILNANRSYYLCRSQPPFLTQMALRVFNHVRLHEHREELDLLKDAITAAIKEYNDVWCCEPRLDKKTGLSAYHPDGLGIPPETEPSHFHAVLSPYCQKYGLPFEEFTRKYNDGEIHEPSLDEYFVNDRAVRESGHDTTYRLEGVCADLATVDLNSLLYKYESDIAFVIETYFNNNFVLPDGTVEKKEKWIELARLRKERMDKYMWSEEDSLYYDYNVRLGKRSAYESVTSLYPMWANLCSKEQAEKIVKNSIPKFEEFGGLVSGTERSRGEIGVEKPSRQWDYPYAWAPHQMIAWKGLSNYGYYNVARRLSYRWCYMMTLAFVDFNGIVVEKYDATSERQPHKVDAEYGNQGSGFKGVATEGFGWVNASYLVGLGYLDRMGVRALGMVTPPRDFFHHMRPSERKTYALDSKQAKLAKEINESTKERDLEFTT